MKNKFKVKSKPNLQNLPIGTEVGKQIREQLKEVVEETKVEPTNPVPYSFLPQYQCHKMVRAMKIGGISPLTNGSAYLIPKEIFSDAPNVHVGHEYMDKHRPVVGGYLVVYEDGYLSFSPEKAFEHGYVRLFDGLGAHEGLKIGDRIKVESKTESKG